MSRFVDYNPDTPIAEILLQQSAASISKDRRHPPRHKQRGYPVPIQIHSLGAVTHYVR